MKKIFILSLLFLLVGCSTTKTNTSSNRVTDTQEFVAETNIKTIVKAIEMQYTKDLMYGNEMVLNTCLDITKIEVSEKPESGTYNVTLDDNNNIIITLHDVVYGSQICSYENNTATCVKR